MVRIKDVAKEAGVAASTVSLVMNKKGYVSEATRQKVEAAMKKLKYVQMLGLILSGQHSSVIHLRHKAMIP